MTKLLRAAAVIIPLCLWFLTPFGEPIKRRLQNRTNLRWHLLPRDANNSRAQTLAVHNEGASPLPRIKVQLGIRSTSQRPISDFDFATFYPEPRKSFLQSLAESPAPGLPQPDRDRLLPVMDEHSNDRSLYALDRAFDDMLAEKLKLDRGLKGPVATLQKASANYRAWHQLSMQKCKAGPAASPECRKLNGILESWELARREFQSAAGRSWREATGVSVSFPDSQFSLSGNSPTDIHFTFPLDAEETGYLGVHYGPDTLSAEPPQISSSTTRYVTRVDSLEDLRASSLWILAKYYTFSTVFWTLLALLATLLAWQVLRPLNLLPNYKLFNIALKTRDHDYWELAAQRQRYFIRQAVEHYRAVFNRPNFDQTSEQLFDFVRRQLTEEYRGSKRRFDSDAELDKFIRGQLKFRVLTS